jgi:hypothetical protein
MRGVECKTLVTSSPNKEGVAATRWIGTMADFRYFLKTPLSERKAGRIDPNENPEAYFGPDPVPEELSRDDDVVELANDEKSRGAKVMKQNEGT